MAIIIRYIFFSLGKFNYFFRLNFFIIIKCLCIKHFKNSKKATGTDQFAGIEVRSNSGFILKGTASVMRRMKRRVEMSSGLQKR